MIRPVLLCALASLIPACQRRTQTEEPAEAASANAEHVETFWSTYQKATRARLDGRFAEAAEGYRRVLDLDPAHQDSLFYLAVSLEAEGFYREAVAVLRELVDLYPENGRGWSQLGAVLATRAPGAPFDLEGADDAFRRSEAINPEHSGSFVARGELALERGDLAEAARLFGIAADMGSPEALFDEGLVALFRGDPAAAMESFVGVFDKRAKEEALTGKGVSSEGDVDASRLSALDSATVRARAFAYWTSRRLGGYPESVREEDRLELLEPSARLPLREVEGRVALADLDGDGRLEIVSCSASGLRSSGSREALAPAKLEDVVAFDEDGDGWVDLYGVGSEGNVLLRNEGGSFADVTAARGLGACGRRRAPWRETSTVTESSTSSRSATGKRTARPCVSSSAAKTATRTRRPCQGSNIRDTSSTLLPRT